MVAIGSIVIAAMRQVGYTKDFAAGVICNAGTLGILIPPSIVMVVYASATDVSVGRMFLAGVVPGILAGVMLMVDDLRHGAHQEHATRRMAGLGRGLRSLPGRALGAAADRHHHGRHLRSSLDPLRWREFVYWKGGAFTPTEAAAVAAVYAFFVASFIYRDMGPLAADRDGGAPMLALSQADGDHDGVLPQGHARRRCSKAAS